MRRLLAGAGVLTLALAVPVSARPGPTIADIRLAPDTAVTVVAGSRLTLDYTRLRSSGGPAFGVYVTGTGGVRAGVILAAGLSTAGVLADGYLVPLWLDPHDRPDPGGPAAREVPAGTYTFYGLGGATSLRLSAVGGVRVRPAARTQARVLTATVAHAKVVAGETAPVWDVTGLRARSRQRVVVAAQLVRDTVGAGGPAPLNACLSAAATQTCATDSQGDVTYEHAASGSPPSFVEAFHALRFYDRVDPETAYRVRVEPVSVGAVRSVTAVAIVWDPPAGV
jgi:hypothetical protein